MAFCGGGQMEGSWEGRKYKTSLGSVESVCFCHHTRRWFCGKCAQGWRISRREECLCLLLRESVLLALAQNTGHFEHYCDQKSELLKDD